MAYSRTLAELEEAVRREADMVNSQFVTSAEVRAYINQSWAELYDRIVLFDQEYLLRYVDITSTGAGEYDLLQDGKTGIITRILNLTTGGTGYVVGDTVDLENLFVTPTIIAKAVVDSVDPSTGAILTMHLLTSGAGYWIPGPWYNNNELILNCNGGTGSNAQIVGYCESDFYKCKGVWFGNNNQWNPLRRFNWDEQNALRQIDLCGGFGALPLYRVYTIGGREKIGIAPDSLSGSFRIYYYPAPQKMTDSANTIDGRAGWDEWVVKDSAIKCLLKEESIEQAAAIKAVRDELFQRFQLHASERDASQPERIRNVRLLSRTYGYWR